MSMYVKNWTLKQIEELAAEFPAPSLLSVGDITMIISAGVRLATFQELTPGIYKEVA